MELDQDWITEGWRSHDGGECPIDYNLFVDQILYRSGDIADCGLRAGIMYWKHDRAFPTVDIVAYLVK